jgi:putative hydrolase of the HAD superfamily
MNQQKTIGIFVDASGTLFRSVSQFGLGPASATFGLELYAEASFFLDELRKKNFIRQNTTYNFKTALITNWSSKVYEILKGFHLQQHFDCVLHPSSTMPSKPHARIFLEACETLNLDPKNCFHIGDSFYDDALGAQNAGLQGIWLHRGAYQNYNDKLAVKELIHAPCDTLMDAWNLIGDICHDKIS